ncbi:MAG: glutamate--tRNA ligase [Candidatus Micrarchaeaceae archaeon]
MDYDAVLNAARKHAIKNALDYGKAQIGPVISKVFAEVPDSKSDRAETAKIVAEMVEWANKLTRNEVELEASKYTFPEKKQREGLPDLQWVAKGEAVNTRFAPNPSGFLHIGHAKVAILCDEYAKKYNGKFYIRLEDTDPKTKKPILKVYDSIVKDVEWLGCKVADVIKQSSRMEIYYSYAEKLISLGKAYVCTCEKETLHANRREGIACPCRALGVEENFSRWKDMMGSFHEGEAVLRLKTDMKHSNISVRDWIMFRIIEEEHPLTGKKYRVWPLYNFAAPIDDHELHINLVIRGKEHEINQMKQSYIFEAFGWEQPHVMEVGVLKVRGEMAHKSDIRKAIEEGRLSGWDDPRAPTIMGFRNSGIPPEAIRKYIIDSGIGKNDSYLDMQKLAAIARSLKAQ